MFIDVHVHLTTSCELPVQENPPLVAGPGELIEMFDAVGIDRAVMLPLLTPESLSLAKTPSGTVGPH